MYLLNSQGESTLAYVLHLLKESGCAVSTLAYVLYLLKESGCAVVPSIKQLKAFKLPGLLLPRQVCIPAHRISFASQQNIFHSI